MSASSDAQPSGGLLLIGSTVLIAAFNYALNITLSWTLTPAAYGVVGVSQALIFVCGWFLMSAFPWVTTRRLSASGDPIEAEFRFLKGMFAANLALSLFLAAVLALSYSLGWIPLGRSGVWLIAWVIVIIVSLGMRNQLDGVLQGRFAFRTLALIRTGEVLFQFVTALILVGLGFGAAGALGGFALGTVASLLLAVWLGRGLPFWRSKGWGELDGALLKEAAPFLIANLCAVLIVNLDLLLLNRVSSVGGADEILGRYQAAVVLSRIPYFIGQSLITIIFPLVSKHAASRRRAILEGKSGFSLVWIALGINVLLIAAPETTLHFFFPHEFGAAALTLRLLATSMCFIILAQTFAAILQGTGRAMIPAIVMPIAVVAQVGVAAVLIPIYADLGAAISSLTAGGVALFGFLAYAMVRLPDLLSISMTKTIGQGVAFGLLAGSVYWLPLEARIGVAIWVAAAVALYAAVLVGLNLIDSKTISRLL